MGVDVPLSRETDEFLIKEDRGNARKPAPYRLDLREDLDA